MKKRLFTIFLALCLVAAAFSVTAGAVETASGVCGENLTWILEDNVLTISGSGPMDDCTGGAPWDEYRDDIHMVVLSGGVTTVGAKAFMDYDNLTAVDFGTSLVEIGPWAFASCDGLTSISLPSTFRLFEESSFQSCSSLQEIHCDGRMPSFRQNCLWDSWVTIYYPVGNPWGQEYIQQLEAAFHGRVKFLASDGSDPYETATEPEITEPPTTPPVTTEPETTEPPVETPTEEPTEPLTTQEPEVVPPSPTDPPAPSGQATVPEAPQVPDGTESSDPGGIVSLVIAIVIGLVCLTLLILLIIRWKYSGHGKYSARR